MKGHYETTLQLLETAADPSIPNNNNFLPISIATTLGHEKIAKLLHNYGSSITYPEGIDFDVVENVSIDQLNFNRNEDFHLNYIETQHLSSSPPSNYLNTYKHNLNNSELRNANNNFDNMVRSNSEILPHQFRRIRVESVADPMVSPPSSPTYSKPVNYNARGKSKSSFRDFENSSSETNNGINRIDKNGLLTVPISPLNLLCNIDKERRIGYPLLNLNEKLLLEKKKAREKRRIQKQIAVSKKNNNLFKK